MTSDDVFYSFLATGNERRYSEFVRSCEQMLTGIADWLTDFDGSSPRIVSDALTALRLNPRAFAPSPQIALIRAVVEIIGRQQLQDVLCSHRIPARYWRQFAAMNCGSDPGEYSEIWETPKFQACAAALDNLEIWQYLTADDEQLLTLCDEMFRPQLKVVA
ncbi:hypothetical protein [Anatilimnocola floriformis]|uniref:hypothetical protein n=1 Tax=Anatilimnocola floriformis TaxID=2948575 RepID=UPI0020C2858A|nr:hypothetical protein [Anatilimnocola floriformis]